MPTRFSGYAPYDGMLVSRGIVGGDKVAGKYSEAQAMRFRRVGARRFLAPRRASLRAAADLRRLRRLHLPQGGGAALLARGHGRVLRRRRVHPRLLGRPHHLRLRRDCSTAMDGGTDETRRRFDITLENARAFLPAAKQISNSFTPLGVIQGWSPGSMAEAARQLVAMGYDYLALGGTVPLKSPQIKACLRAIREAVPPDDAPAHPRVREGQRDRELRAVQDHQLRHDFAADPRVQGREGKLLPAGRRRSAQILHRHPRSSGARKHEAAAPREAGCCRTGRPRRDGARGAR